jgi:HAD superfamily hydrolase (TIGR01549 family)
MVRAILFDLGDTLLNFQPLNTRAIVRQGAAEAYQRLRELGCRLPSCDRYRKRNIASVRWALIRGWLTGREFNALDVMRHHAAKAGAPDTDEFMRELAWTWYKPVVPFSSIEPDLIPTLQTLRAEGLKLGIVSNTFIDGQILDRHLKIMGLFEFFPVRIYSSEVGYRKPHPLIFHTALNAIGTRPRETLFVGDVVKNDVIGAGRLGMKTAFKQLPATMHKRPRADYIIKRIAELVPILVTSAESSAQRAELPRNEDSDQLIQPA